MAPLIIFLLLSCNAMITCYAQIADPENSDLCPQKPPDFSAPWPSCDATALTQDCNYSPGPCMLDPNETCYNIFCSCMNGELVCAVPSGGGGGGQVPPPVETEAPITMAPVTNSPVTTDYGRPINDRCEDATSISPLPFLEEGSVTNATLDEWIIPEGGGFTQVSPGNGVWYKLNDIEPGERIRATFTGMDAMLLQNKDCTLDAFSRVEGWISRTNNVLSYEWTIGDDREISYFLYIAPTSDLPGPDFTINVNVMPPTMPPVMPPTVNTTTEVNQPTSSASSNKRNGILQVLLGMLVSSLYLTTVFN